MENKDKPESNAEFDYADWQEKQLQKYAYPGRMMGIIGGIEQEIPIMGLTKREVFAKAAMQGLLANPEIMNHVNGFPSVLTIVNYTDTLLEYFEES